MLPPTIMEAGMATRNVVPTPEQDRLIANAQSFAAEVIDMLEEQAHAAVA
jgi:hypothetical protein